MRLRSSKTLTAPTERNACVRWAAVVFAMVASLFLAIACAPSKKTAERGSTTFVTTVPNDKAPTVYATPKLVCATPGGLCPEALALFVSRSIGEKDSEFFQCTSFLVAPNVIATNSHCIPQDLRAENASCSGRIQAIFGRSAHAPAQKFDCERVLSSSQIFEEKTHPEYMKRPDYAFIQLKSAVPRRQPLRFSREGLPDGFLLKVPTIDPSEDPMEIRSTLKIKTCRTMQNSLVSPGYTHAFANLASSAGCETIHGNSGSPMLDVSGRVRAILYGARDGKDQLGHTGAVEMPKKFKTTTLLSNAACIETPQVLNLGRADSRCSQTSDDRIFERAISETPLNVSSLFQAWASTAPAIFEFDLKKSEDTRSKLALPVIACVKKLELWPRKSLQSPEMEIEIPVWGVGVSVDAYYRVSAMSRELAKTKMQVTVDLSELEKSDRVRITETASAPGVLKSYNRSTDVPVCD